MGVRGIFHEGRVSELVEKFPKWREERLPGVRAFQSTYDRYGGTSVFIYLMPDYL